MMKPEEYLTEEELNIMITQMKKQTKDLKEPKDLKKKKSVETFRMMEMEDMIDDE